jgi:hypothetical protein
VRLIDREIRYIHCKSALNKDVSVKVYLSIHNLFNDAVNNSDDTSSNESVKERKE